MTDIEKLIKRLKCPQIQSCPMDGEYPSCKVCQKDLRQEVITEFSTLQAENEKLRAEVNRLEYERDYPCIYFRAGGLCRYGGDESEANICVMGHCGVETTAEVVDRLRAELERVKAEKAKIIAANISSGAGWQRRTDMKRLTEKRDTPLVMSMWPGDSRSLRIYNRLAAIEDILGDEYDLDCLSPCILCRFNPPSSSDGKPCCMCPAEAALRSEKHA